LWSRYLMVWALKAGGSLVRLEPWRWKQHEPPKRCSLPISMHDVTKQEPNINIFTAVKTRIIWKKFFTSGARGNTWRHDLGLFVSRVCSMGRSVLMAYWTIELILQCNEEEVERVVDRHYMQTCGSNKMWQATILLFVILSCSQQMELSALSIVKWPARNSALRQCDRTVDLHKTKMRLYPVTDERKWRTGEGIAFHTFWIFQVISFRYWCGVLERGETLCRRNRISVVYSFSHDAHETVIYLLVSSATAKYVPSGLSRTRNRII
jgi:hypothetical protein